MTPIDLASLRALVHLIDDYDAGLFGSLRAERVAS